jgi:hypothetical protein
MASPPGRRSPSPRPKGRRWSVYTVKIAPDGTVRVYKGAGATPVATYQFAGAAGPSLVSGGVGLATVKVSRSSTRCQGLGGLGARAVSEAGAERPAGRLTGEVVARGESGWGRPSLQAWAARPHSPLIPGNARGCCTRPGRGAGVARHGTRRPPREAPFRINRRLAHLNLDRGHGTACRDRRRRRAGGTSPSLPRAIAASPASPAWRAARPTVPVRRASPGRSARQAPRKKQGLCISARR